VINIRAVVLVLQEPMNGSADHRHGDDSGEILLLCKNLIYQTSKHSDLE